MHFLSVEVCLAYILTACWLKSETNILFLDISFGSMKWISVLFAGKLIPSHWEITTKVAYFYCKIVWNSYWWMQVPLFGLYFVAVWIYFSPISGWWLVELSSNNFLFPLFDCVLLMFCDWMSLTGTTAGKLIWLWPLFASLSRALPGSSPIWFQPFYTKVVQLCKWFSWSNFFQLFCSSLVYFLSYIISIGSNSLVIHMVVYMDLTWHMLNISSSMWTGFHLQMLISSEHISVS